MLDSWPERGGAAGAGLTVLRYAAWYWRRRRGTAGTAPIFGWLARRALTESLLVVATIRLKTAQAKIARLEAEIAGMRSDSDGSAASGYDLPESSLTRSKPPTDPPSASTSAKPGAGPT